MKAAIVHDFNQPPVLGDISVSRPGEGELLVYPSAASISQLVRAKASGRHYSSGKQLPQVPGVDGVGRLEDGRRVFFAFPRQGSMAEQAIVPAAVCVPLPDQLDDITAAALANPGMSSVAALRYRAAFQSGDCVLINGAAGASGRLAITIARFMGASRIVATARNPAEEQSLLALGADEFICLNQTAEALTANFRESLHNHPTDIVLDYLWGQPAACLLDAIPVTPLRSVRFVNIGSLAGADVPLNASTLRGKNLQLLGSGIGSVADANLIQSIRQVLEWAIPAKLQIATKTMPLEQVTAAWAYEGPERLVLTM
jgi:NADPH:quinone reductase-like Zn-dependent oxidoreductase